MDEVHSTLGLLPMDMPVSSQCSSGGFCRWEPKREQLDIVEFCENQSLWFQLCWTLKPMRAYLWHTIGLTPMYGRKM